MERKTFICAFSSANSIGSRNHLNVAPSGCTAENGFDPRLRDNHVSTCTGCFVDHLPKCERFVPSPITAAGKALFEEKYRDTKPVVFISTFDSAMKKVHAELAGILPGAVSHPSIRHERPLLEPISV